MQEGNTPYIYIYKYGLGKITKYKFLNVLHQQRPSDKPGQQVQNSSMITADQHDLEEQSDKN